MNVTVTSQLRYMKTTANLLDTTENWPEYLILKAVRCPYVRTPQIRSTILALYKLVCMYVCMYVCTSVTVGVASSVANDVIMRTGLRAP